jgi:hypothetical protein
MASPHVAGVVALLWSARPQLVRDIAATKSFLQSTANPDVSVPLETCGGTASTQIPNNSFGYGRVDALAAFNASATPTPTPTPTPPSSTVLGNISARLPVETGDNTLIGGFIVTGSSPKSVLIRAIGPSLAFAGKLANPTLELRDSSGGLLQGNDDWINSPDRQAISDTGLAPGNDLESAIIAALPANEAAYTAVVRGANDMTGIGVVEIYDLDRSVDSKLANISSRGLVQNGDNALFAGTIVLGQSPQRVVIRAIGPSLNMTGQLSDPTLELRNANGDLIRENDNWRTGGQATEIMQTGLQPPEDAESAIVEDLPANGATYTAIVRGAGSTTGIAVVEVYALDP